MRSALGAVLRLALTLCFLGVPAGGAFAAGRVDVVVGEVFPDLAFEGLVAADDYGSLGLSVWEGPFRLSQVGGELLVLEFLNKHCVPCQRQVRRMEAFYGQLASRGLAGRVRLLGVAAGNQAKYLPRFREKRGLTFPLAADPDFSQWRRLGEPGRTPLSVFLRRSEGGWVLAGHEFGVRDEGWLLESSLAHLRGTPLDRESSAEEPAAAPYRPDPGAERSAARRLLSRLSGRETEPVSVELRGGARVFRAGSGPEIFVLVSSREPVCEICHGVHFAFAFDREGRVLGFEPIFVTKWGNEEWTAEDVAFFEARLRGRTFEEISFDEEVDAVSRATISSTIIFFEIKGAEGVLRQLPAR